MIYGLWVLVVLQGLWVLGGACVRWHCCPLFGLWENVGKDKQDEFQSYVCMNLSAGISFKFIAVAIPLAAETLSEENGVFSILCSMLKVENLPQLTCWLCSA